MNCLFRRLPRPTLPGRRWATISALLGLALLAGCRAPQLVFRPLPGASALVTLPDSVCSSAPPPFCPAVPSGPARVLPVRAKPVGPPAVRPHRPARGVVLATRQLVPQLLRTRLRARPGGNCATLSGVLFHALLLLVAGIALGMGGVLLGAHLGGLLGGLTGVVSVLAGLIMALLSVAALTSHADGEPQSFNLVQLLGYLLVVLGVLAPASVFAIPGTALLCLSAGLLVVLWGWGLSD